MTRRLGKSDQPGPALLIKMFEAGIRSVSGRESTLHALRQESAFMPDLIIAVGKAACEMCLGAYAVYGDTIPALIATKYRHCNPAITRNSAVTLIEAGHPVPDKNSLHAGRMLLDSISDLPANSRLLMLISGGASAIAECLPPEMTLRDWQEHTRELLASGLDIEAINRHRKAISLLKGGRLLAGFKGSEVVICAISDVQGDSISTIGSGIGDPAHCRAKSKTLLVASNRQAREAVARQAEALGYPVRINEESLYDDLFKLSKRMASKLCGAPPGVYIWGGEPTITLPDNPGNGGRNQSLALALAGEISGLKNITILVAGSDGTDGPTDAAGGIVDGTTFRDQARAQTALANANAGEYLEAVGSRFITGPTGTNVMDLVIALVT